MKNVESDFASNEETESPVVVLEEKGESH